MDELIECGGDLWIRYPRNRDGAVLIDSGWSATTIEVPPIDLEVLRDGVNTAIAIRDSRAKHAAASVRDQRTQEAGSE